MLLLAVHHSLGQGPTSRQGSCQMCSCMLCPAACEHRHDMHSIVDNGQRTLLAELRSPLKLLTAAFGLPAHLGAGQGHDVALAALAHIQHRLAPCCCCCILIIITPSTLLLLLATVLLLLLVLVGAAGCCGKVEGRLAAAGCNIQQRMAGGFGQPRVSLTISNLVPRLTSTQQRQE